MPIAKKVKVDPSTAYLSANCLMCEKSQKIDNPYYPYFICDECKNAMVFLKELMKKEQSEDAHKKRS